MYGHDPESYLHSANKISPLKTQQKQMSTATLISFLSHTQDSKDTTERGKTTIDANC